MLVVCVGNGYQVEVGAYIRWAFRSLVRHSATLERSHTDAVTDLATVGQRGPRSTVLRWIVINITTTLSNSSS